MGRWGRWPYPPPPPPPPAAHHRRSPIIGRLWSSDNGAQFRHGTAPGRQEGRVTASKRRNHSISCCQLRHSAGVTPIVTSAVTLSGTRDVTKLPIACHCHPIGDTWPVNRRRLCHQHRRRRLRRQHRITVAVVIVIIASRRQPQSAER